MRCAALVALCLALAGCFAPPSSTQRLADAAVDMNAATRFGRMDLALEHVGAAAREEFARRHAVWGGKVRVVDLEMGGFKLVTKDEAEVLVNVAWLRPDEATMRVTQIAQRWRDEKGRWQLASEERRDGDLGLLGEDERATAAAAAKAAAPKTSGSSDVAPRRVLGPTRVVIREQL